jgi:hypothetical protein
VVRKLMIYIIKRKRMARALGFDIGLYLKARKAAKEKNRQVGVDKSENSIKFSEHFIYFN